jgi:hypothetical protein
MDLSLALFILSSANLGVKQKKHADPTFSGLIGTYRPSTPLRGGAISRRGAPTIGRIRLLLTCVTISCYLV